MDEEIITLCAQWLSLLKPRLILFPHNKLEITKKSHSHISIPHLLFISHLSPKHAPVSTRDRPKIMFLNFLCASDKNTACYALLLLFILWVVLQI